MVFSSILFLFIFLPIFLIFYFCSRNIKYRNIVLLVFSLLFYCYGEPIYLLLMIFSIVINYYLARHIVGNKKIFVLSLILNIGILFVFKYFNFFLSNINNVFNLNIKFLSLSLPIGISFYTFQILTYVIDVYKGEVSVQNSLISLGCYVSAFPQLIAGPIVRYSTVNKELETRDVNISCFYDGIVRFIIGLFKKAVIANEMAYVADSLFGHLSVSLGFIGTLIASVAYMLQIYFDFSGYSDMAIGLGRMLGFHYLENFNYPYIATSITDFWRRWHISLSSFFRDYVYIPLGGNRKGIAKQIRNILIVWLLTGLWHGASWNFILWGLYYGLLLIIEKFILGKYIQKCPLWLRHIYTLFIILIGWIIFYFTDLSSIAIAIKSLFGVNGLGEMNLIYHLQIITVKRIVIFALAIISCIPISTKFFQKHMTLKNLILFIMFIFSVISLLVSSYNPFIYFRF